MKLFVGAKAVIHNRGRILLLRESKNYLDGSEVGKWDVPGGRISPEETLDEGLSREVAEECGLTVTKGVLLGAFDGFPIIRGEKCHVVRLYFLCESESDVVKVSSDHDAYDWATKEDIADKVLMEDVEKMIAVALTHL